MPDPEHLGADVGLPAIAGPDHALGLGQELAQAGVGGQGNGPPLVGAVEQVGDRPRAQR
jgi:hypothetical protein